MALAPGEYRARIEKYGIGETQAKAPQAVVEFSILELGELTPKQYDAGEYEGGRDFEPSGEKISWYGSFALASAPGKTAARDITLETLSKLGFNGDFGGFAEGVQGGTLKIEKVFCLQVIENNYDGNHPDSVKVSSVWNVGDAPPGARILSTGDAKAKLAGLGLEGDFAKLKKGGPANAAPAAAKTEEKKGSKAKF